VTLPPHLGDEDWLMRWLLACFLVAAISLLPYSRALAQEDRDETYRLPPVDEEPTELTEVPADASISPAQTRRRSSAPGEMRSPLKLNGYWMPAANTDQSTDLSFAGSALNLAVPVRMSADGMWLATLGAQQVSIGGSAVLPDSGRMLPGEFYKVQAGAMHVRQFENGSSAGGMVSVGSASDEPFASFDQMTATVLAFWNLPRGDRDAWNLSIFYSPTSQIPFPIPGVAYDWHPSDQFSMKLGVPLSVEYRPTETTTFTASYMPLTNVRAFARQRLGDHWQVYAGYEVVNETWLLADRADANDRLFFFDQRARLGLERKLPLGLNADVSLAYVFDREIFQSASFSSHRRDVIEIDPGLCLFLGVHWQR
jgi:hypothetical protein